MKKQSQNKPNFRKAKMNVNLYVIKDYENERLCRRGENKPNFKPNFKLFAVDVIRRKLCSVTV
jgi:hypothetical protein